MKSKQFLISISVISTSLLVICIVFAFSKLTPSASPTPTFHSLDDIYKLITTGATSTLHSSISTTSSPTATTSHSISEIYALLANVRPENLWGYQSLFGVGGSFGAEGNYGTPNPNYVSVVSIPSSISPASSTAAQGYSLEELYNLVNSYIRLTSSSHALSNSGSPSSSMHTLDDIYNRLVEIKQSVAPYWFAVGYSLFGYDGVLGECELNSDCSSKGGFCGSQPQDGVPRFCTTGTDGVGCLDNSNCDDGLWCDTTYLSGDNGQYCRPNGSRGYGCSDSSECVFGVCIDGVCNKNDVNGYCEDSSWCLSGICDTTVNYTCSDGSIGSGCGSNADCATGLYCGDTGWNYGSPACTDGSVGQYCGSNSGCASPNVCDINTYTCVDGSNGVSCASSLDCSSGHCYGNVCTAGTTAVDGCDSPDDCTSGYCDSINNICSSGAPGSACGSGLDCNTYNCVSNICSADLPPLTTGLVGYWPFNETSGTVANDLSGNGNNATIYNGVLINQTGKVGKAFSFDGINDYVAKTTAPLVSKAFTISTWVNPSIASGYRAIVGTRGPGSPSETFDMKFYSGNLIHGDIGNGNGWITTAADASFIYSVGTWYHVVYVVDTTGYIIYLDGVNIGSGNYSNGTPLFSSSIQNIYLGMCALDCEPWKGLLDEVAIWNRPLTPAEITTLYNGGAGMSIITP